MPNIKSAKKRVKQAEKRTMRNLARKSAIKTATKKVIAAVEVGDVSTAKELLKDVNAKLSRAKSKGLLHANTASRKMSRLSKKVSALEKGKK